MLDALLASRCIVHNLRLRHSQICLHSGFGLKQLLFCRRSWGLGDQSLRWVSFRSLRERNRLIPQIANLHFHDSGKRSSSCRKLA